MFFPLGGGERDALNARQLQLGASGPVPWFHLTWGRLLFVLLAVEACLLLLGQFRWFGLFEDKGDGWLEVGTLLIGLASVGVATLLVLSWFLVRLGLRRRRSYR